MRELDELFASLEKSTFRRSFRLRGRDQAYLHKHGLQEVLRHAADFIAGRLAPASIANDGKQTPFRGHPVFVAQHATACCCRGCLQKWHRIPAGMELTPDQQAYVVSVLQRWLQAQLAETPPVVQAPRQRQFDLGF